MLNRREFFQVSAAAGVGANLLLQVGCGTNEVITDLDLVVAAAEAVLPAIAAAAGMPPALVTQIESYLAIVSQDSSQAAVILAGPGTAAQKAAQITQLFVNAVAPNIPPQYAAIATAVQAVVNAVVTFLTNFQASKMTATRSKIEPAASVDDKAKLDKIQQRCTTLTAKLAAMKH